MEQKFNRGFEEVYSACKKALHDLDITIDSSNKPHGTINGSTSGGFLSWGENIEITVAGNNRHTTVTVDSSSKAQLVDWGTNSENEENILDTIEEILS
jgi:hypothetical protein